MKKIIIVSLFFSTLFCFGCNQFQDEEPTDYQSLVEKGLKSGETHNELFLDYTLKMKKEDFREQSWEMNSQEIISGLVKIDYPFDDLKDDATMTFYPDFKDGRISKMPVDVYYEKWAPWNKEFSSDSLMVDLVNYYETIYNTRFHEVYVPHLEKNAYVSVEGNRAITVSRHNEMIAKVEFIDLNAVEVQEK